MIFKFSLKVIFTSFLSPNIHSLKFKDVQHLNKSTRLFSSTHSTTECTNFLPYIVKPHNSIEIDIFQDICQDSSEFAAKLWNTIEEARKIGKSSIFLSFPMLQAHYIPIAGYVYVHSFDYHFVFNL
jgi:hypothetical protein